MRFLQNDYFKQRTDIIDSRKSDKSHLLALNGYELSYSQKEISDVILALASGDIGEKEILQWIIEHQKRD